MANAIRNKDEIIRVVSEFLDTADEFILNMSADTMEKGEEDGFPLREPADRHLFLYAVKKKVG